MTYLIQSPTGTKKIAELLAKEIVNPAPSRKTFGERRGIKTGGAVIVTLTGELGSGKTVFAQGFARGLGIKHKITSPTFLIIKSYKLKVVPLRSSLREICRRHETVSRLPTGGLPKGDREISYVPTGHLPQGDKLMFHIDCYRIKNPEELLALGFKEIASNPKNIILVEWAERVKRILPCKRINVSFRHGKKENERIIIL